MVYDFKLAVSQITSYTTSMKGSTESKSVSSFTLNPAVQPFHTN